MDTPSFLEVYHSTVATVNWLLLILLTPSLSTACLAGYDEVAIQFNTTLELYNALLRQINSTLSRLNDSGSGAGSGDHDDLISPELLEQLQNYQVLLEKLLERAKNAIERYTISVRYLNILAAGMDFQDL